MNVKHWDFVPVTGYKQLCSQRGKDNGFCIVIGDILGLYVDRDKAKMIAILDIYGDIKVIEPGWELMLPDGQIIDGVGNHWSDIEDFEDYLWREPDHAEDK